MKYFVIGLALVGTFGCQQKPLTEPPATTRSPVSAVIPTPDASSDIVAAQVADVQLDKETYLPGDEMQVTVMGPGLTDSAWVGVIPANIPHGSEEDNDSNDLGYIRTAGGIVSLVAPREPGDYDARLNDSDEEGKEVASRSFKVTPDPSPVAEPKMLWEPSAPILGGSEVVIEFEAPLSFAEDAWIGIVPSATPHGDEDVNDKAQVGYVHLDGRSRGKVKLIVPTEPGDYDVRMYDSDHEGKEVGAITFEVVATP